MAYTSGSHQSFIGGSGQMAVISELLHRKCNAAIPIVDIGTDVFAFRDDRDEIARIQVKSAKGKPYAQWKGYRADFRLPLEQLERTDVPPLYYALIVRLESGWGNAIVISRARLQELREDGCGTVVRKRTDKLDLKLYVAFHVTDDEQEVQANVCCGNIDLTDYLNAWDSLPPLRPIVDIDPAGAAVP